MRGFSTFAATVVAMAAAMTFAVATMIGPALADDHPWKPATVSVEVRYEPGKADKYTGLPWRPGMNPIDATKLPMDLRFTAQWIARFQDWMILEINGVKNQGPGKPNWLYCIDGFPVSGSPSRHRLAPGAEIIWTLEAEFPPKNCE